MDTKGKVTKSTPPSQWFKNVAKSLGYSSANVIKDITPSISSMVSSNATYTKELADKLRSSGAGEKFSIGDYINVGTYVDIAKSAVNNAYSDILSGNIYNKDRQASAYEEGDIDDFDYDSFGDLEPSTESTEESTDSEGNKTIVNQTINNVDVNKDVGVLADAVHSTIDQAQKTAQASTDALIVANTNLMSSKSVVDHSIGTQQIENMRTINENLSLLINFQNDSMAKYIGASIQYYDESLGVMKEQIEIIKMSSPAVKKETERGHAYDDVFQNDVINFEGYVGNVKKNFNKLKEENFLVNSIFTMGSNTEQLQYMANAPLKFLADMATKHLIPMAIRATMERLDKSVTEFVPALFNKFSRMGYSNNPIIEIFGKLFGIDTRMKTSPRMSGYERGAIPFDGEAKRALTDVIPTYLRKMLSALTGSKEIAFDWENGRWSNVEEMRKAYEAAKMQQVTSGYSDAYNEATSHLNGIRFNNQSEQDTFKKGIDELFFNLAKSESIVKFDDSEESRRTVKNMSGLEGNLGTLLSAIMNNMDNATKMSTANNYKSLSNLERFFTNIEKNPTLYNANTILTGLKNDEFLKSDADGKIIGSKSTKGGGVIGARNVDGFGKDQLYYLRQITKSLITGIKTFVINNSPSNIGSDDSVQGSLSVPDDIALNAERFNRVKPVKDEEVVALRPNEDLAAPGKERKNQQIKESQIIDLASGDVNSDTFNADIAARKADMKERPKNKDSFGDYIGMNLEGKQESFNKVRMILDDVVRKPADVLKLAFDKIDSVMYNIIFGKNNDVTTSFMSGVLDRMTDMFDKVSDFAIERVFLPVGDFIKGIFSKTAGAVNDNIIVSSIKDGIKYWFVGNKEDGKRQGGVFSSIMNDTKDLMLSFNHSVTGIGYRDSNGVTHNTNEESLFHGVKGIVKDIGSSTKKHFFGDQNSENSDNRRGILGSIGDMLGDGLNEWNRTIFGKADDDKTGREILKEHSTSFIKNAPRGILGYLGGAAAGGVIYGGGLGLMGSFLLPGGPMGLALLGGALGIASGSDTFKEWAFGEIGGDGKRIGGQLISSNTKEFLSRNKTKLIGGAIGGLALNALSSTVLNSFSPELGAIASFLSPFGPIGAAFQGMATAMILKSETVLSWMFGAKNVDGVRIGGVMQRIFSKPNAAISSMNTATKLGFKAVGIGGGAIAGGALASTIASFGMMGALMATPIGPITGAIAGLAAAIALSSGKMESFLFGSADNKDNEGLIERAFGSFKHYITDPITESFKNTGKHFANWITNFHLPNLAFVTEPIVKMAKDITFDTLKVVKATLLDIPWTVTKEIAVGTSSIIKDTFGAIKTQIQGTEFYNTFSENFAKPMVDTMHKAIGLPFRALTSGLFKATTMITRGLGDLGTTLMIIPGAIASSYDFAREGVKSMLSGTGNLFSGTIDLIRKGTATGTDGMMVNSFGGLLSDAFSLKRIGGDINATAGERLRGSYSQLKDRHQAYKERRVEIKDENNQWKEDWGKGRDKEGGSKFYGYGKNRRLRPEHTEKFITEFEKKTGVGVNEALNIDPKVKIGELKKNQYDYLNSLVKDSIRSGKKGDDFRKHRGIEAYQRSQEEAIRSVDEEVAKGNEILADIRSLVTSITEVSAADTSINTSSTYLDGSGVVYNRGNNVDNVSEVLNFTSGAGSNNSDIIELLTGGSQAENRVVPNINMNSMYMDGKGTVYDSGKSEDVNGEIKFTSNSSETYSNVIDSMVRRATYADDRERLNEIINSEALNKELEEAQHLLRYYESKYRQKKDKGHDDSISEEDNQEITKAQSVVRKYRETMNDTSSDDESVGGSFVDSVTSHAKGKVKSLYNNAVPISMRRYTEAQVEEIGCGPIVLSMVLAQYGTRVSAEKLFTLALDNGLVEEGVGVSSKIFQIAARKYGMSYSAYKGNMQGLKRAFELSDNIIVRISTSNGHYVLLRGYSKSKGTVMVNDPMGKFSGEVSLDKLLPYITHVYIVYKKGLAKVATKLNNLVAKQFTKNKPSVFTTAPSETGGSIRTSEAVDSPEERGMMAVNKSVLHVPSKLNISDLGVMPVTIIKTRDELKLEEERFEALIASNGVISTESGATGASGEGNGSNPDELSGSGLGLNRVNTWMSIAKSLVKGIYGMGKGIAGGLFGMGKAVFNFGKKTRDVAQGTDTFNMPTSGGVGRAVRAVGGAVGGVVRAGFSGVRRVVNNIGGMSAIASKTATALSQAGDVGSYANLSAMPNGYSTASSAEENFRFVNDGTSMGDQKKAFNKRNNVNAFLQRKAEEAAAAAEASFKGSMVDLSTRIEINTRMTAQMLGDLLDLTKGFTDWMKPFLENKLDECCPGGGGGVGDGGGIIGGIGGLLDDLLRLLPLLIPSWLRNLFRRNPKPEKPEPRNPKPTKPDPGKPVRTPTVVDLRKNKDPKPIRTPMTVDLTKKPTTVPTVRTPKPSRVPAVPTINVGRNELPPTTRPVKDAVTGRVSEMPIRHDVIDAEFREVRDPNRVGHTSTRALPEPQGTIKSPQSEPISQPKPKRMPTQTAIDPQMAKYLEQQQRMAGQLDELQTRSRQSYQEQTGRPVTTPETIRQVPQQLPEPARPQTIVQAPQQLPEPARPQTIVQAPQQLPEPARPQTISGGRVPQSPPVVATDPRVAEYLRQQQQLAGGFDDLDSRARTSTGQPPVETVRTNTNQPPRTLTIDRTNAVEAEVIPDGRQQSSTRRSTSTSGTAGNAQLDDYLRRQNELANGFDNLNDRANGRSEDTSSRGRKGGFWKGVKNIVMGGSGMGIIAGSNQGVESTRESYTQDELRQQNAEHLNRNSQAPNDIAGGSDADSGRSGKKNIFKTIVKSGGSSLAKIGGIATGGALTAGLAGLDYHYGSTNAERIFNMEDPEAVATDTQKKAAGIATAAVGLIPFADLVDELALEGKMKQTVAEFTEGILGMSGNINEIFSKGWETAVAGVTTAVGVISTYATEKWDEAKTYLGERWDSAVEGVKLAGTKIGEYTTEKWGEIKTSVSDSWTTMKTTVTEGFTNALDNTKAKWEEMKTSVTEGWTNIKTAVVEKTTLILTETKAKWEELKTNISTKWKENVEAVTAKLQAMIQEAKDKWELLKTQVSTGWNNARTAIVGKVNDMIQGAKDKWESIKTSVGAKWDSIKSTIVSTVDGMVKTVATKWGEIKNSIGTTWDTIKTTITSSIETAISTIGSFSLTDALSGLSGAIKTRLVNAADNFSFTSLFTGGGKGIGSGPDTEEGPEMNKAFSKVDKSLEGGTPVKLEEVKALSVMSSLDVDTLPKGKSETKAKIGIGGPTEKDGMDVTEQVEAIDFSNYGDEPSFAKGCLPCKEKKALEEIVYGNGPSDSYYQTDPRWSGATVAGKAKIGDSGCGPTVAANLVKSMTGNNVTPLDANKYAKTKGLADEKLGVSSDIFGGFGNEYGLETARTSINQENLEKVLGAGNKLVLRGEKGDNYTDSGHYVIADGITDNGKVKIQDPMGKSRSGEYTFDQVSKGLTTAFAVRGNGDGIKQTLSNPEAVYALGGESGFSNPMPKGRLTSKYGYRTHPKTGEWKMHWGIDLANGGGTPIQAAADGTVVVATRHKSYGNYVILKHSINGKRMDSVYAHMSSLKVKPGESVKRGQILGYEGSTGLSDGAHLHFEIHNGPYSYGKNNVDPEPLIFKKGSKTPSSFLGDGLKGGLVAGAAAAVGALAGANSGDSGDIGSKFNFSLIPDQIKMLPDLIDKITDVAFFGATSTGISDIFSNSQGGSVGDAGEAKSSSFNPTGKKKVFIDRVKPGAVKSFKEYGVIPSLVMAQAAEESGWGKHAIGNNLFGIKAGKNWEGKTQEVWTTEEDSSGKKYQIKAKFRDYNSIDDSILDHAKLLTASRYAKVLSARNYREATKAVREAGYATNSDYTQNLNAIIEGNGFMQIDKEAGAPVDGIKGIGGPDEKDIFDVYKAMEGTKLNSYQEEFSKSNLGIGGPEMSDIPNVDRDIAMAQQSLAELGSIETIPDAEVVHSFGFGRGDLDVYRGNYETEKLSEDQNRIYNNQTTNITSMIPEGGAWSVENVNRAVSALETIASNSFNKQSTPVLHNTNVDLSSANSSQASPTLPPMARRNNTASQRRNAIVSKGRK